MAIKKLKILSKQNVFTSPWVRLLEKQVEFAPGRVEPFYSIEQSDYISIFAITPSKKMVFVRQFRPAVEQITLEIPAGNVDPGESAEQAAIRELKEETGHTPIRIENLGSYYPDTGRFANKQHAYYMEVEENPKEFVPEEGIEVVYLPVTELEELIHTGGFNHQLHVSVALLAYLRFIKPIGKL